MEARHGRKLTSAAYEIAHDTEPPGRLAPEVSLSRIRGLTCEILAHAPMPSPFQFPLFPFLSFPFLSSLTVTPALFNHRLSLLYTTKYSLSCSITTFVAYLPDCRLFFSLQPLSFLPSSFLPWLDKLILMASCERQVSSVSPVWRGTLASISPSKFK